jgi:oligopeptide/dipeptide ABC transporter ATP-binding protein
MKAGTKSGQSLGSNTNITGVKGSQDILIEVADITVSFRANGSALKPVDDISFHIKRGEILGMVGESGSGKTITALSMMRLIEPPGRINGGHIMYRGEDLLQKTESEMRKIRGKEIAMIWQDPMASLNPVKRIGDQIEEVLRIHRRQIIAGNKESSALKSMATRTEVTLAALEEVNIAEPAIRMKEYPHQLSGGMQQRVMIAMALVGEPSLLIADEPTTALDVTIQLQILELLKSLQKGKAMSILLITHDLGVVAEMCHRVQVMYCGRIVESADKNDLFDKPAHPYTQGLLKSIPRHDVKKGELDSISGVVPDLTAIPQGCAFHTRCPMVMDKCRQQLPDFISLSPSHQVRCHLYCD